MSYTIYKSDGTAVTVADNVLSGAYYTPAAPGTHGFGTALVGRNTIDYGAPIAQNFLQMTENFAGTVMPADTKALQGQLWFNKTSPTTGDLYVRITANTAGGMANWQRLVTADGTGNTTMTGDLAVTGNTTMTGDLAVTGNITQNGHHVPSVYTSTPVSAINGDMLIVGSTISMYAAGAWKQIFPAVYS